MEIHVMKQKPNDMRYIAKEVTKYWMFRGYGLPVYQVYDNLMTVNLVRII